MKLRSITPFRTGLLVLAFALCAPLAFGQMPQGNTNPLSSEDVSEEEVKKVARILIAARQSTRQMQMKKRREMKKKYGNMQEMDSTKKAQAKREMMQHQRKVRKKQMKAMQQEAQKEGMDPSRVRRIMSSTQQDSTLQQRLRKAMKSEMKSQAPQMDGGNQGGGN
jgi:predicted metal-dependent peptidase